VSVLVEEARDCERASKGVTIRSQMPCYKVFARTFKRFQNGVETVALPYGVG